MTSIEHESERPIGDSQDSARARKNFDERLESASIVRALDLPEPSEFFFLNWPLDSTGQILGKTIESYRFCSTVEGLLDSLENDGASIPIDSHLPEDENRLDSGDLEAREPIIIFADLSSASESHRELFLTGIMSAVLSGGGLVIARQDWGEQTHLAKNTEIKVENIDKSIQIERVLAFPSVKDPSFLFREDFLNEKKDAWRAVA